MNGYPAFFLGAALLLGACDGSISDASSPSFFIATVDGAVKNEFHGAGTWHEGSAPGIHVFQLSAWGRDEHADQRFSFAHDGGGRLGRGAHRIELPRFSGRWVGAQYWIKGEGIHEQFIADSGKVVITRSTPTVVSGTFAFRAFRYCLVDYANPNPNGTRRVVGPCSPRQVLVRGRPAGAPEITVRGSFSAVRWDLVTPPNQPDI